MRRDDCDAPVHSGGHTRAYRACHCELRDHDENHRCHAELRTYSHGGEYAGNVLSMPLDSEKYLPPIRCCRRRPKGCSRIASGPLFSYENGPVGCIAAGFACRDHASHADAHGACDFCFRGSRPRGCRERRVLRHASHPRAVPDRPRRPARDRELRDRPVGNDRVGVVWAVRRHDVHASLDEGRDALDGQGRDRQRVPVEGVPHAAERRTVLLPRDARRRRPARSRRFPHVHDAGTCRLLSAVLVRGLRRLGARRRERQQSGSAEPPRHARRQRRPLRGHDRRQRLPVRQPDELRRSEAGRGRDGRDLRRSLLARSRRLRAALHGIRQPRAQRHRARRPHQLAAGCRRLELGRPLRERPLLLRQRHDRDQLCERLVRLRRRAGALLRTHVGLGRHQSGHGERLCERLRGPLRAGHARVHVVARRPPIPSVRAQVRVLPLPVLLGRQEPGVRHVHRRPELARGPVRDLRRERRVQRPLSRLRAQHAERSRCPVHLHLGRRRRHAGTDRAMPQL